MPKRSDFKELRPMMVVKSELLHSQEHTCAYPMPDNTECDNSSSLFKRNAEKAYKLALHSPPSDRCFADLRTYGLTDDEIRAHHVFLAKYNRRRRETNGPYCPQHEALDEYERNTRNEPTPLHFAQYRTMEQCGHKTGHAGSNQRCGLAVRSDLDSVAKDHAGKRRCSGWTIFRQAYSSTRPLRNKESKASSTGGKRRSLSASKSAADIEIVPLFTHDLHDDSERSLGLKYHTTKAESSQIALQELKTFFGMYCDLWNMEDGTVQKLTESLSEQRIFEANLNRPGSRRTSYDVPLTHGISFRCETNVSQESDDQSLPPVSRYTLLDGETPLLQYHTSSPEEPRFALEQLQGMFQAMHGRGQFDLDLMVSQLPGLQVEE